MPLPTHPFDIKPFFVEPDPALSLLPVQAVDHRRVSQFDPGGGFDVDESHDAWTMPARLHGVWLLSAHRAPSEMRVVRHAGGRCDCQSTGRQRVCRRVPEPSTTTV